LEKTDLSYFSQCGSRPGWVISETRFRVDYLRSRFPDSPIYFASRSEAARRLLRAAIGDFARLDAYQALQWLVARVQQEPAFEVLRAELDAQTAAGRSSRPYRAIHRFGEPILGFFDAVRLEVRGEQVVGKLLDEFGDVKLGQERLGALFLLLEDYRRFLREERKFDDVGVWEALLEELLHRELSKQKTLLGLGDYIVLDQPMELTAVERDIWKLLSRVTELRLLLPESFRVNGSELPLSVRSASSVISLFKESKIDAVYLPPHSTARADVIETAINGRPAVVDSAPGVAVWRSAEIRDEVKRVVRALSYSLEKGTVQPQEIHIIALDLPAYEELLENELASYGLKAWVTRGRKMAETPGGALFQSFIRWLRTPGIEELRSLALNAFFRAGEGNFPLLLNAVDRLGLGRGILQLEACRKTIGRFLGEERIRRSSKNRLLVESEREIELALAQLEADRAFVDSLRSAPADELARAAARYFRSRRKKLRMVESASPQEIEYTVRSLRMLPRLLREAARIAALRPGELLENFFDAAEEVLENSFCQAVRGEKSIAITELLDARAMHGGVVIILGAASENFPPRESPPSDELSEINARIRKRRHSSALCDEAYGLLAHLIASTDELVLSFAAQRYDQELHPAQVLERLRSEECVRIKEPPEEWRPPLAPSGEAIRRTKLIEVRAGSSFSPFDGSLAGETTEAERVLALTGGEEESLTRYSPSGLEEFADCPHSFYFHRLLGLEDTVSMLEQEIAAEIGKVVHDALDRFFGKEKLGELLQGSFDAACAQMRRIAADLISKSFILSMPHPAADDAQRRIVAGLEDPSDRSPRGFLKAALVFQRDVISTRPQKTEVSLRVQFERSGQKVELVGMIDRVDSATGAPGEAIEALWDYKTGKVPDVLAVDSGRSLQVPLYALALERSAAFEGAPTRGGFIHLSRPNRRDEFIADPKKGVATDILGAPRKNSTDPRAERIAFAEEQLFRLDRLLRDGDLHQVLETRRCSFCDFRTVCYRDEPRIARRLAASPQPEITPWRGEAAEASQSKRNIRLREEQIGAADTERNISLRAGAGSGKTQVMCARIINLVLSGAPISGIVAVTFTEDAAAEIRARVERLISEALEAGIWEGEALKEPDRALLFQASTDIAQAPIGTIHAFAARLIAMDPVLSGIPEFDTILEGGAKLAATTEAVKEVLVGEGRKRAAEVLSGGVRYFGLEKEIRRLVTDQETLSVLLSEVQDLDRLSRDVEALREQEIDRLFSHLRSFLQGWKDSALDWLSGSKVKDDAKALYAALFERTDRFSQLLKMPADCGALNTAFDELYKFVRQNSSAAPRGQKGKRSHWLQLRDELEKVDRDFCVIVSGGERDRRAIETAKNVLELAESASTIYRKRKLELGALDFDDLIGAAHRMLVQPAPPEHRKRREILKTRIDRLYQHVLVDEFQDTDARQWEIVREVVSPDDAAGRTLFIVGDTQQSIYRFRGGDVRVFRAAENEICEKGGERLSLHDNHRAHPDLLRFVQALFEPVFGLDWNGPEQPVVNTAVKYQPMRAVRGESEGDRPRVSAVHITHLPKSGRLIREAEAVADFISQVLSEPKKYPALLTAAPGGEIAVLVRTAAQMGLVAGALESRGIPFSISHSHGFYDLEEIVQFENLLQWMLLPGDSVALVGVLRSALVGLSDGDLLKTGIALKQRWDTFLEAENLPPAAQSAAAMLRSWLDIAAMNKPSQFLETIAKSAQLEAAYRSAGKIEAFRNIERFFEALRAAEKSGGAVASLPEIRQWLQFQKLGGQAAPSANSSTHPVVLMTLHGSKGLEFPMVILPFLAAAKGSDYDFEVGEIAFPSDHTDELHPRKFLGIRMADEEQDYSRERTFLQLMIHRSAEQHAEAEERRLFYVGCTRAKEYLVLMIPETKTLLKEQKSAADLDRAGREAKAKCFDRPLGWFTSLAQLEPAEAPIEWNISGSYRVPIVRQAAAASESESEDEE